MIIWRGEEWETVRLNPTKEQLKEALQRLEGKPYPHNSVGSYDLFPFRENFNSVGWGNGAYYLAWYRQPTQYGLTIDEVVERIWSSKWT